MLSRLARSIASPSSRSLQCGVTRTLARSAHSVVNDTEQPRLLVIDGYSPEGREDLKAGGASTAGELYVNMLKKSSPLGAQCDLLYPADEDWKIPDMSVYDGVAWTGCSLTIYHNEDPRVTKQIEFAKEMFAKKIPSFGSCWSAQIAVVAAGGLCAPHPKGREMGIARKISLTTEGRSHPMYEGKPSVFDAFISHDDEVTHMPAAGLVLAKNTYTAVQAVTVTHNDGNFWAVQYHPEYDLHELAMLTNCRIEKLTKKGFFRSHAEAEAYIRDLDDLHFDPTRKDLAWKLGIDDDVMNEDIRLCEVRNWVRKQAIPYRHTRLQLNRIAELKGK